MPKAVTAPAAAAEAALEARAAMRLEPQRPSDKGPPLIVMKPAPKPAPKPAEAVVEKPRRKAGCQGGSAAKAPRKGG